MNQPINSALRVDDEDLNRLRICQHHAPHDVYGWHALPDGENGVIRTRQLGAEHVELLIHNESTAMTPLGDDIWVAQVPGGRHAPDYRLRVTYPGVAPEIIADPYHFLPTVSEFDLYLIGEGRHERLWEVLGANVRSYSTTLGEVEGTAFTVWAPNAKGVAVIGEFCAWNPNQYPMRSLGASGVWELFVPGLGEGTEYKFAVIDAHGHRKDHSDPMAKQTLAPPETVSVVNCSRFQWSDQEWVDDRARRQAADQPMSIYEVHAGSWKIGMGYRELRDELVDYVAEQGFTHVEFMPVAEHPFGGSWGYQVSGYYAPTARWGSPDDFRALVDAFHARGIGVIVDWVPAHFPKDDWALARFDGTALYEHPDWRRGEQKDSMPLDLANISRAIDDMFKAEGNALPTPSLIISQVCKFYSVDETVLRGTLKNKGTAEARQTAMYLIRKLTNLSLPDIGKEFARDHSTVLYAIRKVEQQLKKGDETLQNNIRDITANINSCL